MALLPALTQILTTVDRIHRALHYGGGPLSLVALFDLLPGFLVAEAEPGMLPEGSLAIMARRGGCVRIAIDTTAPRSTQRIAVAHEIGHAILHLGHLPGYALEPRMAPGEAIAEAQADFFALELLAPMWAIEQSLPPGLRNGPAPEALEQAQIRSVSRRFEIPMRAALLRARLYLSLRHSPLDVISA